MFSEVAGIASHAATRGISATSQNTTDINLNFPRIHCDYLVITENKIITKFLNAQNCDNRWSRTHRSRALLNLFIRPFFENVLSPLRAIFLVFIFALVL